MLTKWNWAKTCLTDNQKMDLHKVYRNAGPNPSSLMELRPCSKFEVGKGSEISVNLNYVIPKISIFKENRGLESIPSSDYEKPCCGRSSAYVLNSI